MSKEALKISEKRRDVKDKGQRECIFVEEVGAWLPPTLLELSFGVL